MRIGFFMQNVKRGGLDTFVVNLLRNWPVSDKVVLFCNRSHPGLSALQASLPGHIEVIAYNFLIAQDLTIKFSWLPRGALMILRVIFWCLGFPYLVVATYLLFRRWRPEQLMVINGGYPGGDACLAATVAWARFRPDSPAWHNFHNMALRYPKQPLRRLKEWLIDHCVVGAAAGFVTVSSACLASLYIRPLLTKIPGKYIYNGIESARPQMKTSLRRELGIAPNALMILMLAVYEPRKGHAFIFEVMQQVIRFHPEAYLVVCGDGEKNEVQTVREYLQALPVQPNVILLGHRDDTGSLLSQADVVVVPSQRQESFGYTAVEAMASGVPVITTDVGGLPEVVENGVTGWIVEKDNVATFAWKLVELLTDAEVRKRMGEAGRRRVQEKFLAERMALEYVSLMKSVMRK